jgi:hypothetical protein
MVLGVDVGLHGAEVLVVEDGVAGDRVERG